MVGVRACERPDNDRRLAISYHNANHSSKQKRQKRRAIDVSSAAKAFSLLGALGHPYPKFRLRAWGRPPSQENCEIENAHIFVR
jgi:hypothetical protein